MLVLRPAHHADIPAIVGWVQTSLDHLYWTGTRFSYPMTVEQLAAHFDEAEHERGRRHIYVGTIGEAGELVGYGEVVHLGRAREVGRLARILIDPNRRGQGWGQRLVGAMLTAGFNDHALRIIDLYVFSENAAAVACYARLGMRIQTKLPAGFRDSHGKAHDLIRMSITQRVWRGQ